MRVAALTASLFILCQLVDQPDAAATPPMAPVEIRSESGKYLVFLESFGFMTICKGSSEVRYFSNNPICGGEDSDDDWNQNGELANLRFPTHWTRAYLDERGVVTRSCGPDWYTDVVPAFDQGDRHLFLRLHWGEILAVDLRRFRLVTRLDAAMQRRIHRTFRARAIELLEADETYLRQQGVELCRLQKNTGCRAGLTRLLREHDRDIRLRALKALFVLGDMP